MLFYTFTQLSQGENNKLTLAICIYTQTPRPFSKKVPPLIVIIRNKLLTNEYGLRAFLLEARNPNTSSLSAGAGKPPPCFALRGLTYASHPAGVSMYLDCSEC